MLERGVKKAALVQSLVSNMDRLIATILVGNNFVNTAISVFVTLLVVAVLGPKWGAVVATFVITGLVLIFGEVTPKIFAVEHADKVSLAVSRPMVIVCRLLGPLAAGFTRMAKFIIKVFGGHPGVRLPLITEEEIKLMIELGKAEGVLGDDERKLLHRIFEFGDTLVRDVMIPREQIVAINSDAQPDELLDILVEEGHSRVPVYREDLDKIIGVIYARELLHVWKNRQLIVIQDLIHPACFVAENKRVNSLLKDFQQKKLQIAVVTDRNGKTLGLVTLEDLLEEIVGEIEEEYHKH
jgi:CBS domain containing-hemolysin-like protein